MAKGNKTDRQRDSETEGKAEELSPSLRPSVAPSLDLDDAALSEHAHGDDGPPLAAAPAARGNQGDEGRPYCERHNVLMVASGSRPAVTLYRCPVEGCDARAKRVRPQFKIPAQPQMCPQRICADAPAALEVVARLSTLAQLHMACPRCGFSLKVPRPQFGPQLASQRRRALVEDLGER